MINDVPSIIYDKNKNPLRVIKSSRVFFKKHGREERITSISEFDLVENNGNFVVTKDIFENSDMM